jgi:cytochrome c-type biogenesis protein
MNFWGTWCPPCVEEFPHIAALAKHFGERHDFSLLAVSCGPPDQDEDLPLLREETQDFLRRKKSELPTYADRGAVTRGILIKTAHMTGYPFTVVIDRQGVIRGVWEGYGARTAQEMESLVAKLLEEKKGA